MYQLFAAIGYLSVFLVLSIISLICAGSGKKWVWVFYGIGLQLTLISLMGSMNSTNASNPVGLEVLLFAVFAVLFGVLISKRISKAAETKNAVTNGNSGRQEPAPAQQPFTAQNMAEKTDTKTDLNTMQSTKENQQNHYNSLVDEKEPDGKISENELMKIFVEYFVPNKQFYMDLNSPKGSAYFQAINKAKSEIMKQKMLFEAATDWKIEEYLELLTNQIPGKSNQLICAFKFKMGEFSVVKDRVYCVDFADKLPNCIALYLLLIAQRQPDKDRKMILDTGTGVDAGLLKRAIEDLKICDPEWTCLIWES